MAASASVGPPSGAKAAFAFVFVTVALDMLALGVVVPVLPALVVRMRGGDEASAAHWVGLFGTVWAVMQFVAMPVIGTMSDAVGRRPMVLLSNFGQAADYALMALAPDLWWLLVGRVVSGLTSASVTTAFAYVADVTPAERRAGAFGALGAAFGLGFVVGPALGGAAGGWDPRLPFWLAGGLSLLNGLWGMFVLPESLPAERRTPFRWRRANPLAALGLLWVERRLLGLAWVKLSSDLAHVVYPSTFALYAMHRYRWGAAEVGLTLAVVGAVGVVVQGLLTAPIDRRLGSERALLVGLGAGTLGFCVYGMAAAPWQLFVAIPVAAFWGIAGAANRSLMSDRVAAGEQGRLQGAISSLAGLAGLLGPSLFTGAFAASVRDGAPSWLVGAPFFVAAMLVGLSVPVAWGSVRRS